MEEGCGQLLLRYGIEDVCCGPSSQSSSGSGNSGRECVNKKVGMETKECNDVISVNETEYVPDVSVQHLLNDAIQFVELHPDLTKESDH